MGFPILVRWHLYIESGPWPSLCQQIPKDWLYLAIYLKFGDNWFKFFLRFKQVFVELTSLFKLADEISRNIATLPVWYTRACFKLAVRYFYITLTAHVCHGVLNYWQPQCLFNRLFRRTSKKTSKIRVNGPFQGNPQVAGGSPSQMVSNAENVSMSWRLHVKINHICAHAQTYRRHVMVAMDQSWLTRWWLNEMVVVLHFGPISLIKIIAFALKNEVTIDSYVNICASSRSSLF